MSELLQDPFKDPLDPFMDAGRRTASANGDTDATQASPVLSVLRPCCPCCPCCPRPPNHLG